MNEGLKELFDRLMEERTEERERSFFAALAKSALWIPMENKAKLMLLKSPDEKFYIPALLSEDEKAGPFRRDQLMKVTYEALKNLVVDDPEHLAGISIDPFGKNLIVSQRLIEAVDSGSEGMSVRKTRHRGKMTLRPAGNLP